MDRTQKWSTWLPPTCKGVWELQRAVCPGGEGKRLREQSVSPCHRSDSHGRESEAAVDRFVEGNQSPLDFSGLRKAQDNHHFHACASVSVPRHECVSLRKQTPRQKLRATSLLGGEILGSRSEGTGSQQEDPMKHPPHGVKRFGCSALRDQFPKVHADDCFSGQSVQAERREIHPLASSSHWPVIHPMMPELLSCSCMDGKSSGICPQGHGKFPEGEGAQSGHLARRLQNAVGTHERCLRQVSCLPSSQKPELEGTKIQRDNLAPGTWFAHNNIPA